MEVNPAVGFLGDAASHNVADGHRRVALALHFSQGGKGIGRLAALGDGKQERIATQRRVGIAEFAGVFHFDRDAGQGLDLVLAHQPGVPARSAAGEQQPVGLAKLLGTEVQAAEPGRCRVVVEATSHGVADRFGLLKDLLEHVVGVTTQLDIAAFER